MVALARDYSDRLTDDEYDPDPSEASPLPGCECDVCLWCRYGPTAPWPDRPVRPADPQWTILIRLATDL